MRNALVVQRSLWGRPRYTESEQVPKASEHEAIDQYSFSPLVLIEINNVESFVHIPPI